MALVRKELVRPDRSEFPGDDGFRFAHMLIRDAAYEGIPKSRRADLHERVGVLFESRSIPDEVVGYHFEQASLRLAELRSWSAQAGTLADRASDLLAAAGHRAVVRGDDRAAANLLRRARALLSPGDSRLPNLEVALAEALNSVGELKEAEALCLETIQAAAARGDKRTEWLATVQHVWLKFDLEPASWNTDDVRRTAGAALTVFEGLEDHRGLARVWLLVGYVDWNACRFEAAATAFERALDRARRAHDEHQVRVTVENLIAALYHGATSASEAIARIGELMEQAPGRAVEANALLHLGGLHSMQGRFDEGRALYERSKAIRRELGRTRSIATATMRAREIHLLAGDTEAAERELRWGYEALEQVGEKAARSTLSASLAEALYRLGRYEEAEDLARESLEASSPEDIASQVMGSTVMGKILAVKGVYDQAEQTAREGVALGERTDDLFTLGEGQMALAEVFLLADRREQAIEALEAAAETSDRKGNIVTADKARALLADLQPAPSTDAPG